MLFKYNPYSYYFVSQYSYKFLFCKDGFRANDNLEQQVTTIYKAYFEDFIPFGIKCPNEWKNIPLGNIADIDSGKRPSVKSKIKTSEANVPIIGAASIMGYTNIANHSNKILVIGRVGTHGVVQRFNSDCWTSDNTLVISSKYYEYISQILQRIDYAALNRGSTQPLITQGDMKKVQILLPDENTLLWFEKIAGNLMAKYDANILENEKLMTLRDMLLPQLMSGKIDVSNVNI